MPEQLLQTSLIVKLGGKSLEYDLRLMDWSVLVEKEG